MLVNLGASFLAPCWLPDEQIVFKFPFNCTLTSQPYSRTVAAIDATYAFTLGLPFVDVVRKDVHMQWPKLSS